MGVSYIMCVLMFPSEIDTYINTKGSVRQAIPARRTWATEGYYWGGGKHNGSIINHHWLVDLVFIYLSLAWIHLDWFGPNALPYTIDPLAWYLDFLTVLAFYLLYYLILQPRLLFTWLLDITYAIR